MENYIIYLISSAAIILRGGGPLGSTAMQSPPEGMVALKLKDGIPAETAEADLGHLGDALWEHIKLVRSRVIEGGVTTPFGVVDTNSIARANITERATAALIALTTKAKFSVEWTLANDKSVVLDAAKMVALASAVSQHGDLCHARARDLRALINAAKTTEDLLKIDILSGWPV